MDAELAALATAGATALIQQMVTDGWSHMSDRAVSFFSRGTDEESVQGELEESRADLIAAQDAGDDEAVADVQAEWRSRLRRALRADPDAANELRALLDELEPVPDQCGSVNNSISGGVQHGTVIQAHTIGDLKIN